MPWAGIPCWSGGADRWAQETVPAAYALRYASHVRPVMPGNPISLNTLTRVARARARFAEHRTGRGCRPTNATLAACAGLSVRTVQRASTALRLLGVATEVVRGRQRTRDERMASWRVGDNGRGWASVWVLHDDRHRSLAPHPGGSLLITKPSVDKELTTPNRRQGTGRSAARRRPSTDAGSQLARQWVLNPASPSWVRAYRTPQAWARLLAGPERHGWTPRDVNQAIRDYVCVGGNWVPDRPHKPAGLLGAILRWHGDLAERPSALDEAREAAELTATRARIAQNAIETEQSKRAREAGRAALGGPGHMAARQALADILDRRRSRPPGTEPPSWVKPAAPCTAEPDRWLDRTGRTFALRSCLARPLRRQRAALASVSNHVTIRLADGRVERRWPRRPGRARMLRAIADADHQESRYTAKCVRTNSVRAVFVTPGWASSSAPTATATNVQVVFEAISSKQDELAETIEAQPSAPRRQTLSAPDPSAVRYLVGVSVQIGSARHPNGRRSSDD
jgi:hypothetical protein